MIKVINIMNHPPAYEGYRDNPRPKINWDTSSGTWVGIWGYDWHDNIGNKVLEISDEIEYEVWQPDYRANKIFQHTFESGLVHKLFPAKNRLFLHGLKIRKDIYSETLMEELEKEVKKRQHLVIHINADYRFINIPILKKYAANIPIIGQFYTNSLKTFSITNSCSPIKKIHAYLKYYELIKYFKKFKYIIPSVKEGCNVFEKKFGIKVFYRDFANLGRDFNEWSRKKSISEARQELGIDQSKFVLFSSSRLKPSKQNDKLIEALAKVNCDNYICYISGRGSEKYENYLNEITTKHGLLDKIKFVGYVNSDVLLNYYQAANLVVSTCSNEAGPAPVSNAAALGIPTMLTATGIGYEFYKQFNVGVIVPVNDYGKWAEEIENIINGKKVPVPNRKDVEDFGDWKIISQYYYNIYKTVIKQ